MGNNWLNTITIDSPAVKKKKTITFMYPLFSWQSLSLMKKTVTVLIIDLTFVGNYDIFLPGRN